MKSRIVIALSFIFFLGYTGIAQTIGDGCMNIEMVVERSYISSSEDNEFFVIDGNDALYSFSLHMVRILLEK